MVKMKKKKMESVARAISIKSNVNLSKIRSSNWKMTKNMVISFLSSIRKLEDKTLGPKLTC